MSIRFIFDLLYIGFLALGVILQLTLGVVFIGYGLRALFDQRSNGSETHG